MSMFSDRIWKSLAVYAVWTAITLIVGQWMVGPNASLDELVKSGIAWNLVLASALLVAAMLLFRWNDLRFVRPHSLFKVMWFPSLYLLAFIAGISFLGWPPAAMIVMVAINTAFVGFSEETMFRGVIFRALEETMAIWPAIILTSVLFGGVHILNVFITGELLASVAQAVAAALSGLVFIAIVIRTGSIWPAIVYHALWDCLLFLAMNASNAAALQDATDVSDPAPGMAMILPVLFNLPNIIFAFVMLRNVGKRRDERHEPTEQAAG